MVTCDVEQCMESDFGWQVNRKVSAVVPSIAMGCFAPWSTTYRSAVSVNWLVTWSVLVEDVVVSLIEKIVRSRSTQFYQ
jgi:hypothetical protein